MFLLHRRKSFRVDPFNVLLLHMDDTDGTWRDSSKSNYTINTEGDPTQDTSTYRFGGASGLFDGVDDALVTSGSPENWDFGTDDFTIDFWVKSTATPSVVQGLVTISTGSESFATMGTLVSMDSSGNIELAVTGGVGWDVLTCSSGKLINDGQWHHIAIVRSGTSFDIYIDGIDRGGATSSVDVNWSSSFNCYTGRHPNSSYDFDGNIDEVRVSKRKARWTTDFIPPLRQYNSPSSNIPEANLVAFWPFETDFRDALGNHNGTAVNNADISSNSLQLTRATSDRVSLSNSTDFNLGTDDFSMSFWVKQSTVSVEQTVWGANDGTNEIRLYINSSNYIRFESGGTEVFSGTTPVTGKVGTWWLLTISRVGNSWEVWADKTSYDTATDSRSLGNPSDASGMFIGAEVTGPANHFNGFIGRSRTYKGYGLSLVNVTAIYDEEKGFYGL